MYTLKKAYLNIEVQYTEDHTEQDVINHFKRLTKLHLVEFDKRLMLSYSDPEVHSVHLYVSGNISEVSTLGSNIINSFKRRDKDNFRVIVSLGSKILNEGIDLYVE